MLDIILELFYMTNGINATQAFWGLIIFTFLGIRLFEKLMKKIVDPHIVQAHQGLKSVTNGIRSRRSKTQ